MRKNVSEFEAKTMENKFSTLRAVERKSRLGVKIMWKIEDLICVTGTNYSTPPRISTAAPRKKFQARPPFPPPFVRSSNIKYDPSNAINLIANIKNTNRMETIFR